MHAWNSRSRAETILQRWQVCWWAVESRWYGWTPRYLNMGIGRGAAVCTAGGEAGLRVEGRLAATIIHASPVDAALAIVRCVDLQHGQVDAVRLDSPCVCGEDCAGARSGDRRVSRSLERRPDWRGRDDGANCFPERGAGYAMSKRRGRVGNTHSTKRATIASKNGMTP
jgi:hypothetical protein